MSSNLNFYSSYKDCTNCGWVASSLENPKTEKDKFMALILSSNNREQESFYGNLKRISPFLYLKGWLLIKSRSIF